MKNTINNKLRRLPGMLAGLLLLAAAACTPESLRPDYETDDSARSAMTLEFGVSATEVGIRTRAEAGEKDPLADAFESSEVKSLWVGVFDVETGNIVGQIQTKKSNPDNKDELIDVPGFANGKATVDILYYDAHPTVRIFGVANYESEDDHVMGRMAGQSDLMELKKLLTKVEKMSDLYSISVDIASANEFQEKHHIPVLMGVMTKDNKGFFTVDADGTPSTMSSDNEGTDADITLVDGFNRLKYSLDYKIHLRRLFSRVTVNVEAVSGINISNLRYRKYNLPSKEVYLQERTMQADPSDNWSVVTPNVADKFDNGQGYTSDSDVTLLADGQSSFQFYQYENKHWAFTGIPNYSGREAVRAWTDENPIFTALSGSGNTGEEYSYNNYASYFEITMDLVDETHNKVARGVTYRIHEGYCCDEYGVLSTRNANDFSCFRNTKYTYTITISGLNHIDVSAETQHNHDNGVPGSEIWTLTNDETIEDSSLKPEQPNPNFSGKILDYVFYYANGDETPIVFGKDPMSVLLTLPGLGKNEADWKEEWEGRSPLTIDGKALYISQTDISGEIAFNTEASSSIEFPEGKYNPKNYRCELYILTDYKSDDAGCKAYKYQKITYLPEDNREPMGGGVTFKLAFANEWDDVATQTNGAVVGHIKEISVPEIDLTGVQPDVKPVYTLYLNGEEICSGTDPVELAKVNLFTERKITGQYTALQTYPVTVVVSDENDNYSDISEEVKFLVYPTTMQWQCTNNMIPQYSYQYTSDLDHAKEIQDANYLGLYFENTITGSSTSGVMVTGGNANGPKKIFTLDALYDGVISITAKSNTGVFEATRTLIAQNGDDTQTIIVGPSNITEAPYTFAVKKGKVSIYTGASLQITSIKFTCSDKVYSGDWNFSNSIWNGLMSVISGLGLSQKPENSRDFYSSVDGLTIQLENTTNQLTFNDASTNRYISFVNSGNGSRFSFIAHNSGTLKVTVASSADKVRSLYVKIGDRGPIEQSFNKTMTTLSIPINEITQPTEIQIYSSGGAAYYYAINYSENTH